MTPAEFVDRLVEMKEQQFRKIVDEYDTALSELYITGKTMLRTAEGEKELTLEHVPFPEYLMVAPRTMREYALSKIKADHNLNDPPPWLICTVTGETYKLNVSRSATA